MPSSVDKPVLDDEGKEQKDEDGNVITETVEMPVIKAYLGYGEFSRSNAGENGM